MDDRHGMPAELECSSDSGPRVSTHSHVQEGKVGKRSPEDGRADWHFLSLLLESLKIKKENSFNFHSSIISNTTF